MQRRAFLQMAATAGVGLLATGVRGADAPAEGAARQYYELRTYHFASAQKRDAYAKFVDDAMAPALNRLGIQPVGAFTLIDQKSPEAMDLWVFIPHDSMQSVLDLEPRLGADEEYQKAGKEILLAGKSDPAFTRFDTQLLHAFSGQPKLAAPPKNADRIFELRVYENPSEERALNKLKMFNSGEIPAFIQAGMPGVFFGEAFAGTNLPHLTYMVYHENQAASKKNWDAFGANPDWKKLKVEPMYQDNVSKVISRFIAPTKGSQI